MEEKQVIMSAFGVGVGVGAGLGLSSSLGGNNVNSNEELWNEQVKQELLRQMIDGKECKETFQDFPYYLSERTRELLMSAAFVHLKQLHFSRHIRDLPPTSKAILLCGPTDTRQPLTGVLLMLVTSVDQYPRHLKGECLLTEESQVVGPIIISDDEEIVAPFSLKTMKRFPLPLSSV